MKIYIEFTKGFIFLPKTAITERKGLSNCIFISLFSTISQGVYNSAAIDLLICDFQSLYK
jgi:hypothetical protein